MPMKRRDRKVGLAGDLSEEMLEAVLTAKPSVAAEAFDYEVKRRRRQVIEGKRREEYSKIRRPSSRHTNAAENQ